MAVALEKFETIVEQCPAAKKHHLCRQLPLKHKIDGVLTLLIDIPCRKIVNNRHQEYEYQQSVGLDPAVEVGYQGNREIEQYLHLDGPQGTIDCLVVVIRKNTRECRV